MRKTPDFITLVIFAAALLSSCSNSPGGGGSSSSNGSSWPYVPVVKYSPSQASCPSISTDGKGGFYIVFIDMRKGNKVTVMCNSGAGWSPIGSPGFSAGQAAWVSLALDPAGTPFVAFEDYSIPSGDGGKVSVMKYNGSGWVLVGNAGFSAGRAVNVTIRMNGTAPYVAYSDAALGSKAAVMTFDGSSWRYAGSAGITPGAAGDINLAVDGSGNIYLGYTDWKTPNSCSPRVQKYDSTSWTDFYNTYILVSGVQYTSMAIDGIGTPYIAFFIENVSEEIGAISNDDDEWHVWAQIGGNNWGNNCLSPAYSGFTAAGLSLAVDSPSGTPYIAYVDEAFYNGSFYQSTNSLVVINYNYAQHAWQAVGNFDFTPGTASGVSLVVTNGTPYVAFIDGNSGGRISVMRYDGSSWSYYGNPGL